MAHIRRPRAEQPAAPAPPLPPKQAPAASSEPIAKASVHTDPLNELIVIAAMIVDWNGCRSIVRRYTPEFFRVEQHKTIWEGLRTMHSQGLGWDPETLRTVTGGEADIDYLLNVVEARPDVPPNLAYHLEQLEWDRTKIECAIGPLSELLKIIDDPKASPERIQAVANQVGVAMNTGRGALKLLEDPAQLRITVGRDLTAQREEGALFPYGIDDLDFWDHDDPSPEPTYRKGDPRMIVGTRPGMITIITASSGSGKSTVASLLTLAQANMGKRIAYGAWEPQAAPTIKTMAVQSLGYSRTKFNTGLFDAEEQAKVEKEVERLTELVFFMKNPLGQVKWRKDGSHNEEALDLIEGFLSYVGAQVFVADLWDMGFDFHDEARERKGLDKQQEMGVRLGVHTFMLLQQKLKELESVSRPNKRPARELIKGTSRYVDVGDTIMGPYIPGLWKDQPINVMELGILKQRDGRWPLAVEFHYNPDRGMIWGGRSIAVHGVEKLGDEKMGLDAFIASGRTPKRARS